MKCWGSVGVGQLGDNYFITRLTPVEVAGLSGVTAVSAGYGHTCALTGAGGVKCWGGNDFGQLGDNSTTDRLTPVEVAGLSGATTSGGTTTYIIPIANPGTEAAKIIVKKSTDPVVVTHQGNSSSYSNDLYLMLDSAGNPGNDGKPENDKFIFNNLSSPVGSTVDLGTYPMPFS